MTYDENERRAYADGDIKNADMYAQLADLLARCERYECALEAISRGGMSARQAAGATREVLP